MIKISAALRRGLLLLGTTFALLIMVPVVIGTAPATALPPGGASPNTPGTNSVLNARSYKPGDKISFKVTGFPAGETINVKIDDGQECGKAAVHGACVVYKQRISKGTTVGSFRLPTDLKAGSHWLRFLASEEIQGGGGGTKGYSNRSPDFTITVVAKKSNTGSSGSTNKGSTSKGSTSNGSNNSSTTNNENSTSTDPTTTPSTSASPTPSASATPSAKHTKKAKKKATKKAVESTSPEETSTETGADLGAVTPEPVTAIVTGAGLSVAQALAVGGGAVGLAAVVGGLTAWWRRGGQ